MRIHLNCEIINYIVGVMEEVRFKVEAVTPIFIAGADQRNIENEGLRPPSIKGLLRWWFRAIAGGMFSLDDMRKLEGEVFGYVSRGGGQKSKIQIVCEKTPNPSPIGDILRGLSPELRYLWFSMFLLSRRGRRLECYPPGSVFEVVMRSTDKKYLEVAISCFWLLCFLGGVGARSRRGAGCIRVLNAQEIAPLKFRINMDSPPIIKNFIEENLGKIFDTFKNLASNYGFKISPKDCPNFPVLSSGCSSIEIVDKKYSKWSQALSDISNNFSSFRRRYVRRCRSLLGLPIAGVQTRVRRFASPLLIGVVRANNCYFTRIVKFYSSIPPNVGRICGRYVRNGRNVLLRELDNYFASRNLKYLSVNIPEVKT